MSLNHPESIQATPVPTNEATTAEQEGYSPATATSPPIILLPPTRPVDAPDSSMGFTTMDSSNTLSSRKRVSYDGAREAGKSCTTESKKSKKTPPAETTSAATGNNEVHLKKYRKRVDKHKTIDFDTTTVLHFLRTTENEVFIPQKKKLEIKVSKMVEGNAASLQCSLWKYI